MSTHTRIRGGLALAATGAVAASLLGTAASGADPEDGPDGVRSAEIVAEAPVYHVVAEGMTTDAAKRLAGQADIPLALREDGSFGYVDAKSSGVVPSKRVKLPKKQRKDEDGRKVVAQAIDMDALGAIKVLDDKRALGLARELLGVGKFYEVSPRVEHTTVDLADKRGKLQQSFALDTQVSYDLSLNGVPVVGPGARSSVAFGEDGQVIALTQATRELELDRYVGIIGPEEAAKECGRHFGPRVKLATPELIYHSPDLGSSVQALVPQYSCIPAEQKERGGDERALTGLLLPAAPELTPYAELTASRKGLEVTGKVGVEGATKPYSIQWTSATKGTVGRGGASVSYKMAPRKGKVAETLTATVTDGNGLTSAVSVQLPAKGGTASASGYGGGGGALASYFIASPIDEWSCAQNSSNGFRDVMNSKGQTKIADWRGQWAWESDFKRTSNGGHDDVYVDKADIAYYTGHGWSGGFTFKNTTHDDDRITPNDARWGDNFNLEWMNLESCEVLRDTSGGNLDYFARWAPAFDGLHVLNGFDTLAQCNSGTGGRFAEYLFPRTFLFWTQPALSVSQAWKQTANDKQPGGRRWRSVSPVGAGGVHNLNDKFWGQGTVGPDIRANQRIGFISISGAT